MRSTQANQFSMFKLIIGILLSVERDRGGEVCSTTPVTTSPLSPYASRRNPSNWLILVKHVWNRFAVL